VYCLILTLKVKMHFEEGGKRRKTSNKNRGKDDGLDAELYEVLVEVCFRRFLYLFSVLSALDSNCDSSGSLLRFGVFRFA
jgi:hypothetical protein